MLVYLAGPLFSDAERQFNLELAERLETVGFRVFLPQRDGVDSEKRPYDAMSPDERRHAMFSMDRTMVLDCDVFLFVLDGRVPDEGACVELGMAYCQRFLRNTAKLLVGIHTDSRAAFVGSRLNPMVHVPLDQIADNQEELLRILVSHAPDVDGRLNRPKRKPGQ